MAVDGDKLFQEFQEIKNRRAVWNDHYQLIGDYVHGTHQQFTEKNTQGERLNEDRFASEGVFAAKNLASSLLGMLWPSGAQSMRLVQARDIPDTKENKEYFERVTDVVRQALDDPQANMVSSLDEYMLDNVAFGTSGVGAFDNSEDGDSDLYFEAYGTSQTWIAEGNQSKIDRVYRLYEWTLPRVLATFGDAVSNRLKERADKGMHQLENIEILRVIKPREDRDPQLKGNQNMPFMSVFMELETKNILRESGFVEQPVKIGRFRKLAHEVYGRSPAMDSLSDVLELDYLTERFTVNVDKTADPPLLVIDDGRFGGGVIDTSAGAINVYDPSGSINNNIEPIKPLFTAPELRTTLERMEQLRLKISQHFFIDRLLDFNNTAQMTLGEVQLRDRLRGASMGSVFSRQIQEVFNPLISRSFSILLDKGKLGVIDGSPEQAIAEASGIDTFAIPDDVANAMINGENVFEIKYFTPAQRALDAQKAEAINQATLYVSGLAQMNPEVLDYVDFDELTKEGFKLAGLPNMVKADKDVKILREQRAEAQRLAQEQAQQAQQVDTAAKVAQAAGQLQQG